MKNGFQESKEVSRQEGSMGIDIIRPTSNASIKSKSEYMIIFRFNTYDNLAKWEKLIRNEWLQKGSSKHYFSNILISY
ncbi:MAG: hypothetical protein WCB31_13600 [Nitrososphaeraceae archaeon]|nr:hypothetical protein [Nitrososphaeraceae archaeon]